MRELKISNSITSRSDEALGRYLSDISREQFISADEEAELAAAITKGGKKGKEARDRLVRANLRFVVSVAKQYQHRGLALCDLIDEGNIGLVKAAEKFDPTRGFKFISYAVWWIRQSILQALAEKSRAIRLPLNQVGALEKINSRVSTFVQENQRQPTDEELATLTDLSAEQVGRTRRADQRTTSLDAPVSDDSDTTVSDMISGGTEAPDGALDRESADTDLQHMLDAILEPREKAVISQQFGIGCREKGLGEIAEDMGLTRERVRQIMVRGIDKLRKSRKKETLRQYL